MFVYHSYVENSCLLKSSLKVQSFLLFYITFPAWLCMQALYQYWLPCLTESKLYTDEEGKTDPVMLETIWESVRTFRISKQFRFDCLFTSMECYDVAIHYHCLSKGIYHMHNVWFCIPFLS